MLNCFINLHVCFLIYNKQYGDHWCLKMPQSYNETKSFNDISSNDICSLVQSQKFVDKFALRALNTKWDKSEDWRVIFSGLYPANDKTDEANRFREYCKQHTIECLGGGNSLSFKMTNTKTKGEHVFKLERVMGTPGISADNELNDVSCVAKTYASGTSTIRDRRTPWKVLVMDFVNGEPLNSRFENNILDNNERYARCAEDIQNMAKAYLKLQEKKVYFPDGKAGNWMIGEDGQLIIGDTKSLVSLDKIVQQSLPNVGVVLTLGYCPKECLQEIPKTISIESVEKSHAFTLGANLYYYLTASGQHGVYEEPPETFVGWPFENEIFKSPIGQQYKTLIEQLTKLNPTERMNLTDAQKNLESIQAKMELRPLTTDSTASKKIKIEGLRRAIDDYLNHLGMKLESQGMNSNFTTSSKQPYSPKQVKLNKRYQAISELLSKIPPDMNDLYEPNQIKAAKDAVAICCENKPSWSERPFLQKLTDVLTLGFKPLYRAYFSKEALFQKKIAEKSENSTEEDQNFKPIL